MVMPPTLVLASRAIAAILLVAVCACASTNSTTSKAADPNVRDDAGTDGQLVVESSQGTQIIEPVVVGEPNLVTTYNDPWEPFNRRIFRFNDLAYRGFLSPLSRGYQAIVPSPARASVTRFFDNLREPLNALHHAVQLEGSDAAVNLSRFLVNTTVGIGGLFDPAQSWLAIAPAPERLSDTFAHYGVDPGPYLVLPLLGPSSSRDGFSLLASSFYHPAGLIWDSPESTYIAIFEASHRASPNLARYPELTEESQDPYIFIRNMHVQGILRDQWYRDE